MPPLENEKCVPCQGGVPTLSDSEITRFSLQLQEGWKVVEIEGIKRLEKAFKFKDFAGALEFTNQVGIAAEAQQHHPDILTQWGRATVTWWTHKINGLHKNDFIMAARTDELFTKVSRAA